MDDLRQLARICEDEILNRQLPDGGWGFGSSRQWVTETTALSLLALRLQPSTVYSPGLEFLLRCQNPNGSWPGFAGDDSEGQKGSGLFSRPGKKATGKKRPDPFSVFLFCSSSRLPNADTVTELCRLVAVPVESVPPEYIETSSHA